MKEFLKSIIGSLKIVLNSAVKTVEKAVASVPTLVDNYIKALTDKPIPTLLKTYTALIIVDLSFLGVFGIADYSLKYTFVILDTLKNFVYGLF